MKYLAVALMLLIASCNTDDVCGYATGFKQEGFRYYVQIDNGTYYETHEIYFYNTNLNEYVCLY